MESFKELTVKCKRANCANKANCEDAKACMEEPHYKKFSASDCRPDLCNINKYTNEVWQELIFANVSKMNYLVNDDFSFPEKTEVQMTIFKKQYEKHINHKCPMVAVLSAFPIYVLDYFGVETLKKKIDLF